MSVVGFIFWMLVAVGVGMAIMGALVKLDNYDEQKANLLEKQYEELSLEVEEYQPSPKTWLEMIAMHRQQQAELEK